MEKAIKKMEKLAWKVIRAQTPRPKIMPIKYKQIYSANIRVSPRASKRFALMARGYDLAVLRFQFIMWRSMYPGLADCLVCRKGFKNEHGLTIHFSKTHPKWEV